MAYQKQRWTNSPSTDSPINAQRLNHMEDGIGDNDERISALENEPTAHTILNKMGTAMTERPNLQFTGAAEVLDNAPSNKTVVNIPSNLSAFSNDAGFIDNTVNNLLNYYKKTETYTQAEVQALISAIVTLNILVVQTLPTQDISTTTIYLVPKATAETQDVYDEYIYVNNAWEHIGSTQVDLSNYYTKTETDALLADKVDKVAGKQLSTEDFTSALKSKLEGIEAGAQANVQADWNQTDNTADDYIKNKPTIPSGSGHTILDSSGTSMTQRTNMQFSGVDVSDDSTNDKTIVDANHINDNLYVTNSNFGTAARATIGRANKIGAVTLHSSNEYTSTILNNGTLTANRTLTPPDKSGTIAITDDIPTDASDVTYDNTQSGLTATNVQDAIDEVNDNKVSKSGDTMSGNLTIDKADGTVSDVGTSQLIIGNSTPEGTAGNSRGVLRLYGKGANYVTLNTDPTGNRTITVPDAQGTLAMTSDLSDYLKNIQKRGDFVKSFGGSGTYQYYKVATLTITDAHINYPIVFEVSKRNIAISHNVTIIFASTYSTDPNISTLSTNEDNKWYIKKTATSTWELYVDTENVWSPVIIHRIYGYVIDNGVTVTINGTGVSSIPSDSVGAVYRGNVNFANSAGSATSATQATQDGSGNTITSTYVKKAGDTMRGDLFIDKQDGTTSALGHSRVVLGNSTSAGTAKNSRGVLRVYGQNGYYANFFDNNTDGITANRTLNIPNKDGTLAMTSDISSEKFKENIKPLSADEANKLLDVEVVTFDYKDGVCGEDERYNNRGVIAEQVEPIIPYVVEHSTEEDEEVLRVDYRKFIPYLIKVVQNQQTEIDNLKAEIERIKEEK